MDLSFKENRSPYQRLLSGIIASVFFVTGLNIPVEGAVSSLGPVGNTPQSIFINQIQIPAKWGDIVSRFEGNSKQMIIQIQDAHCNFEAQSNTARILEELFKKHGEELKVVNVEGSSGVLDTSALTLFPDPEIKKQLALYYLRQGKISGAEYLSIIKEKPLKIQGVEDLKLYFQNLESFDRALELRERADDIIQGLKKTLNELEGKIFNKDAIGFLKSIEAYEKGEKSLSEHLSMLREMGEKQKIGIKDLKNIDLFLRTEDKAKAIDFEKVDEERTRLMEKLLPLLSKEESSQFLTQNLYFRLEKISAHEYFDALGKLIKAKRLMSESDKNLWGYINYLEDFNRIDRGKLLDEIEVWTKRIRGQLFQTEEEKELVERIDEIKFLRNFYHLELTREDLKYYEEKKDKITARTLEEFLKKTCSKNGVSLPNLSGIDFLEKHLSELEKFYEMALKRDEVMVQNTVKGLEGSGAKIAILIAGGFHTEGIRARLREQGISYVVVSPRITNLEAKSPYLSVMEDKRSPIEEAIKKEIMNQEGTTPSGEFVGTRAGQTMMPMSPMQEVNELVGLLTQPGINRDLVQRKLETAQLFTLMSSAMLEIYVATSRRNVRPDLLQVWREGIEEQIADEVKKIWGEDVLRSISLEGIESIGDRFFVDLRISGAPYGIIVKNSSRPMAFEDFEEGFVDGRAFQLARSDARQDITEPTLLAKVDSRQKPQRVVYGMPTRKPPKKGAQSSIRGDFLKDLLDETPDLKPVAGAIVASPGIPPVATFDSEDTDQEITPVAQRAPELEELSPDEFDEEPTPVPQAAPRVTSSEGKDSAKAYSSIRSLPKPTQGQAPDPNEPKIIIAPDYIAEVPTQIIRQPQVVQEPEIIREPVRRLPAGDPNEITMVNRPIPQRAPSPVSQAPIFGMPGVQLPQGNPADNTMVIQPPKGKAPRILRWGLAGALLLAAGVGGGTAIWHALSSDKTTPTVTTTPAPNVFDVVTGFDRAHPITDWNRFSWSAIPEQYAQYNLRIETSADLSFPVGPSTAVYAPTHSQTSANLTNSMGHTFMRLSLVRSDGSGLVVAASEPLNIVVPVIPIVLGFNQAEGENRLTWSAIPGVSGYRVAVRETDASPWRTLPTISDGSSTAATFDGEFTRARIVAFYSQENFNIEGPAAETSITPVEEPVVRTPVSPTDRRRPTRPHRPTRRPPLTSDDFFKAPLRIGKAEGVERSVDFGRLTGTNFRFNDRVEGEASLTDESRLNYQEKIEEALAFLGRYQDLSDVNLPVTVVEDLNTLADFGHEQDLLRIDTDLLSEKYDSPAMRALYFRHEIHHSRGANEFEAVQGDLAFYGELMKSGERIPEALLKEDPYLSFLNKHHALSSQEQNSATRAYLWRLDFSRGFWRGVGRVQNFIGQMRQSLSRFIQPVREGLLSIRDRMRPLLAAMAFGLRMALAGAALALPPAILLTPQMAQADIVERIDSTSEGYRVTLTRSTSELRENEVLVIETCQAADCDASAGTERYLIHRNDPQSIILTRSSGHGSIRHALVEITGHDDTGAEVLSSTIAWSGPFTFIPPAPGNLQFNPETRQLTWNRIPGVRIYEVSAFDSTRTDNPSTPDVDERWIRLDDVAQSANPSLTINRANLTRVRVIGMRGEGVGAIRSTPSEIGLRAYRLPSVADREVPAALRPRAPVGEIGSIVRMPSGSYVLSLTPGDGVTEYRVYTSNSSEALDALSRHWQSRNAADLARARELGYQEYTSSSPNNIYLDRSVGHNYYLVRTSRGTGVGARRETSEVVTMGSRSLPTSDFYFRGTLGWSAAWPLASDPSTVGEFSLRELTAGAFLTPETPGAGPLRLEGSYRSTPLINQVTSDGQRYRLDYGTITLGSRFGVHLPDFTFRIDPQLGAMIMYKEDVGFYSRMPFELSGIIRPNAHHSFRLGVWGEGRFIALPERQDVLPWDFNTRSGEFIPGSHTRYFDMRRAGLYSGVTARPGVTWSYEDAGHRFSLGAAYEIEIAHPLSHTILGTLEYDYSNLFRITGQGGYYFSNYLPVDETTGVRAAPFVRGRIFARPSPVVEIGASAGFQWGDRELNVSGLDLRFPIPRAEGVTIVAQPLQFYRNELFFGNVTAYSGTIGLEINPNAWFERAPIITGKEPGEVATADRGYLSGGRFNFDETWTEMSGIGEEGRRVYGERLNEALGFLGRYRDLGDVKLSTEIVEDLNTWMDFGHDVDEGPASGFGMERSLLRIDTDALGEKYSKEAVALMLDHELAHARGADEQGAILSNLGLYRRWKQERPGFLFPDALRGEHPFFQFLEEHYNDPIEDQVDAIRLFLYENGFDRDRNITMRMTREEAVEYGRRIQSQTELRQALERVRGFKEGLRREELIGLIQQGITELLGEDIIEDNRGLKQRLERVTRGLARSNLSIDEVMKEVEGIVGVRMETPEEEAVKGPEGRNRIQAVAVAILLVANFLRGGKVAPKVLEGMVKAHLEGKTYEGRALNQMTLDDVVALYGEKRAVEGLTDTELEALENTVGLGKVVKYFNVVGDLKEGNITNAIKTLNELERRADAERDFRDLANQTEAKLITVNSDGALEIAGNFIQTTDTLREQLRALNETVSQRRGRQGPVYIDLTGGGYLHPDRLNKVMESILENPEKAVEGLEIENFIGFDEKGKWGYNDGAKVQVQLVEDVIQVKVQSLSERYEEMMGRVQARMIGKIRNMKKAQVLISTGKTFGIDIEKNKEGQIVVKAQSQDFKRFYTPILEILRSGQNMLKLAIPVVLPKGISRDEVSDELILRALFGEEEYAKLRERLDQEIYVEFYEEGHPAVQTQKLGGQVKQDVAENFRNKGVALDTANPMTFIVSEKEQELYQDLEQALLWIIEGNLDTKKLMLIAEQLTSNGIKDQELLEFLKKADPEAIEEMNRHKLSTPKTMMEEFGLRIKTQRQTATMA